MRQQAAPSEQEQAFGGVIDVLEAIGAVYAVWGGLAVVAYGEPRYTMDMDILLSPYGLRTDLFVRRLEESHYHVDRVTVQNVLAGGYFNVIHLPTQIKTDFFVPVQEPWLGAVFKERVYLPFDSYRQAAYVSVEAAVISKLRAYAESESTRHLDDIASIVRVQRQRLNKKAIDIQAAHLGVLGAWKAMWAANTAGP